MIRPSKKAFTILELLVVIAILGLLATFVIISLRAVRGSATRAKSLNALRQMALAYASYSTDHRHQLLPGYIDTAAMALYFQSLKVHAPTGDLLGPEDAQSYVWRLSPYLDDAWQTMFTDLSDAGAMSRVQGEYDSNPRIYGPAGNGPIPGGISERPAYGLNSIFVGGDSRHGGSVADDNPWEGSTNVIAATRTSQVKNPSKLIVFAPTAKASASSDSVYETIEVGFCELRPPFINLEFTNEQEAVWFHAQWVVGAGGNIELGSVAELTEGAGFPVDRTDSNIVPVAHLDGSSATVSIPELATDMSRWDPTQVGKRRMTTP